MNDERLQYLQDMAQAFSEMNPRLLPRQQMLTVDISEATALTLRGLVDLTKLMHGKAVKYIILGEYKSDRLEGEFGIYRKEAAGNYFIAVELVINGLRLQRLKLFRQLNLEYSNDHFKDACCYEELNVDESDLLDSCFAQDSLF